ncbi:DUF3152 domain-containing protein [Streptomyces bambusae]|uniref:DUF3152 domain-containing protein n=1 Tax=Streptomyces bambusae TaxID=1550616 RepID=UPI001CFFC607|nr:DUF3152 domain-containing protein [Streptomyces bambusae]MCB5170321.1 DUF3152 domain-containing protein [Streptomyces bambusae]
MGRHSRKGPAPEPPVQQAPAAAYEPFDGGYDTGGDVYGTAGEDPSDPFAARSYGADRHEDVHGFPEHSDFSAHAQYPEFTETGAHQAFPAFTALSQTGGPALFAPSEPTVTHSGYGSAAPGVRGGHPETREPGGGWGDGPTTRYGDWRGVPRTTDTPAFGIPQVRVTAPAAAPSVPGPRRDPAPGAPAAFEDAFGTDFGTAFGTDLGTGTGTAFDTAFDPAPAPADSGARPRVPAPAASESATTGSHRRVSAPAARPARRGPRLRTYTGIAAALVTAVLAVFVTGQVTGEKEKPDAQAAPGGADRAALPPASRSEDRPAPQRPAAPAVLTYDQKMAAQYPIDPKLKGPDTFRTVPGTAKAPGKGEKIRYRVDVENGLDLDAALFAEAVQRTLNDKRSWAGKGDMTFERVASGDTRFVITLASPGTTGTWCAKSDLDTVVGNVSCDSAQTERVMINAFRWAQGSDTFGPDKMFAYRQMLINHEVGHRLGHSHVNCTTPGALAPIMQQQTKSLSLNGIVCKPNPWVYPGN